MTKFESRPLSGDAHFEVSEAPPSTGPNTTDQADTGTLGVSNNGHAGSRSATDDNGHARSPVTPIFHTLTEHEFDVVAVVDGDGRFIFVSSSAERLFGFEIGDAVGRDAFALFDPASIGTVRSLFADLVARRRLSISFEMQAVRADGTQVDLDVVAVNHLADPIGGIVVNIRDITGRKQLEQRVLEEDRRQATVIDSLADGVLMVDAAGTVVRVNESFEVMFEAPRIRVVGRRLETLLSLGEADGTVLVDGNGEEVAAADHPVLVGLRHGRRAVGVVLGVLRQDRRPMWVRINIQPMIGAGDRITGAVASFSDITAARQAAAELRREEQFLQVLLDTLEEGIVACDAEGRITVFNPAARRLHGLSEESDPIGTIPSDEGLLGAEGSPMDRREDPLLRAMSGEQLRDVEIVLASEAGDHRKVSVNGQALVDDDGWMLGAVVAMHDVTEQKRNEERLAELALHDPLTGLANRTLLAERLQQAIDGLARSVEAASAAGIGDGQHGVAVFLLDLDEFKEINDGLGHDVGDDMLIAVARRLSALVRPSDTVARLGGDEFVVVCDIESGEEEMILINERISSALARPYRIDGRTLSVLASVGGVFVDNPDTDPSKLLSRADDAMYGVKWSRRRERRSTAD
jgi:diguanylate cyclase (GGDEF)-like protein/PAS domain S-box-containing protein